MTAISIHRDLPLRELTTLAVGGPAAVVVRVNDVGAIDRALEIARDEDRVLVVLGGGSNVIVADDGLDAVVLQIDDDRLTADLHTGRVRVAAGYDWDALVAWSVQNDLAGLECLSGIPGRVGAAPIQNIGAYGQEIAEVVEAVHAVETATGRAVDLDADACRFAYRDSRFKRAWRGRYVVTGLTLRLRAGGEPTIRYEELRRRLEEEGTRLSLATVREQVLAIRRGKSMVIDPDDENRRSAGSFFTNPVVDDATLGAVRGRAHAIDAAAPVPTWSVAPGRTKIPAAWLIERSGFERGHVAGRAGLSTRHVLALINRGQARADELLDLARSIRDAVGATFGVRLVPEPVPLGFDDDAVRDLWG